MTTTNSVTVLASDTKGRVHTPAQQREALLDLFEQSGLSGAAFARLHGLRYPTFAHWWKLRREARARSAPTGTPLFQEVTIERAAQPSATGVTIDLPQGARLRLESADQIPLVALLCRYLREGAPC